ncbi:MAG: DNA-directed RNA polymerase subunit omega [Candidatus Dichloromethanomonas elyunquensis]|nr:MAG: DNA-directed RNA polymerase subunit omega [Candidatus Dichloromethanomonas elyunquensis]
MRQPSLDILMSKVDSKYTLVVAAAKRARALMAASTPDEFKDTKPVSRALEEISKDTISFDYIKEGNQ